MWKYGTAFGPTLPRPGFALAPAALKNEKSRDACYQENEDKKNGAYRGAKGVQAGDAQNEDSGADREVFQNLLAQSRREHHYESRNR